MSALNKPTRPETVRHARTALLPVPLKTEPTRDRETNKPVKMTHKKSILFQAEVQTSTGKERNDGSNTVNLTKPLPFQTADTDVAFIAKQSHKIGVTYGKYFKAMHTAVALINTRAGVKLERQ